MMHGIHYRDVDASLPYAAAINKAAGDTGFSALFLYAIAYRETIREYGNQAAGRMSDNGDGGYGLCQLTAPWATGITWPPVDWDDAYINASLAVEHYLFDALEFWIGKGYTGEDLVKLTAATFNEGLDNAIHAHDDGNVDLFDTDNYGAGVVQIYLTLVNYGVLS